MREASAKGIKKYGLVISQARQRNVPLSFAETYARAHLGIQAAQEQLREAAEQRRRDKKVELIKTQLGLSTEDARALLEQAHTGDEAAWAAIRRARQSRT